MYQGTPMLPESMVYVSMQVYSNSTEMLQVKYGKPLTIIPYYTTCILVPNIMYLLTIAVKRGHQRLIVFGTVAADTRTHLR